MIALAASVRSPELPESGTSGQNRSFTVQPRQGTGQFSALRRRPVAFLGFHILYVPALPGLNAFMRPDALMRLCFNASML
jgi:hypothetical protein